MLSSHTRAAHGDCFCSLKASIDGVGYTRCTPCRLVDECPYCTSTSSKQVKALSPEGAESPEEVERERGTIGNPVIRGSESARRPVLPDVPLDGDALPFEQREHHWCEGLYFARGPQGTVRIRQGNNILALIPPAEWCSIVAALSKEGGQAHEYSIANYLHMGGDG